MKSFCEVLKEQEDMQPIPADWHDTLVKILGWLAGESDKYSITLDTDPWIRRALADELRDLLESQHIIKYDSLAAARKELKRDTTPLVWLDEPLRKHGLNRQTTELDSTAPLLSKTADIQPDRI
jgi:hypothetical protein